METPTAFETIYAFSPVVTRTQADLVTKVQMRSNLCRAPEEAFSFLLKLIYFEQWRGEPFGITSWRVRKS